MTDTSQYTGSHKERYNLNTFAPFHTRQIVNACASNTQKHQGVNNYIGGSSPHVKSPPVG